MDQSSRQSGGFDEPVRLNRFLARCGIGSRRAVESLVSEGAVEINGRVVTDLAHQVDPKQKVLVNGIRVKPKPPQAVLLNKPRGFTCSQSDEQGRQTIYNCLPPNLHHLQHVGRLDRDSEGLLVLTNDGDLAQQLAHPKHKVEKEYLVTLHEAAPDEKLDRLLAGVKIEEGQVRFRSIFRVSARRVRVVLAQGYKRQVRRMFATLGLQVRKLVRIRVGALWLDDTDSGRWRFLEASELDRLARNPHKSDPPSAWRTPVARTRPKKRVSKKPAKATRSSSTRAVGGRKKSRKRSTSRQVRRHKR